MKKILSIIIVFCLIISTCAYAFAEDTPIKKTKYVYVDRSAKEGGIGTKERPYRSIEEARDTLRPMLQNLNLPEGGLCIVIAEGEYRFSETFNLITEDSGKDGRYVTYKGEGEVYFIGGETGTVLNGSIISAENVDYLAFENIKFKSNANAPLVSFSGSNVRFKDCTFSDSAVFPVNPVAAEGYALSGVGNGIAIEGCEFFNLEGAVTLIGGTDVSNKADKNLIFNCYVHDVGVSGITNIPAISISEGVSDISHNEINDIGSDALVISGASHRVSYNVISPSDSDASHDAIRVDGGFLSYGSLIEYNFIDSFGGTGISLTEGVSGATVCGNVIKDTSLGIYLGGGRTTGIKGNLIINTSSADMTGILYDSSFRNTVTEQIESSSDSISVNNGNFTERVKSLSKIYPELSTLYFDPNSEESLPYSDPSWYFNPADSEIINNAFYVAKGAPAMSAVTEGDTVDGLPYQVRYGCFYSNAMMPRGDFSDFPKMRWNNFSLREDASVFKVLRDFEMIPFEDIGRLGQARVMYFTDVGEDDWFYPFVVYTFDASLMSGTNKDGTIFSPYTVTTRAMLVQMLYNLEGNPEVEYSDIFTDVKETDWCAPAVMWAYKNGITAGTGDGRFDPNASVTREQIAVFLYRFISEYKGEAQEVNGTLDSFGDKDEVSPYAGFAEAVTWAVDKGIIGGKNEFGVIRLAPRDVAQRCETAAVIARFHEGFVK